MRFGLLARVAPQLLHQRECERSGRKFSSEMLLARERFRVVYHTDVRSAV